MQPQDKFNAYQQQDLSVLDFIHHLQDLANTVGDLEDSDVILAFWRRCQPYIQAELMHAGLEPADLTIIELESLVTCIEHAESTVKEAKRSGNSKLMKSSNNHHQGRSNDKKCTFSARESTPRNDEDKAEGSSKKFNGKGFRKDKYKSTYPNKCTRKYSECDNKKIKKYQEEG